MKSKANPDVVAAFEMRFPKLAQELGRANIELLLDGASVQEYAAGRVLIRDRMPVESIYFVLEGELTASIEEGGKSRAVGQIKPGEWMGEISVLSGERLASATVSADTRCKLVKVHHMALEELIGDNETVGRVLLDHFIDLMATHFRAQLAQEKTS